MLYISQNWLERITPWHLSRIIVLNKFRLYISERSIDQDRKIDIVFCTSLASVAVQDLMMNWFSLHIFHRLNLLIINVYLMQVKLLPCQKRTECTQILMLFDYFLCATCYKFCYATPYSMLTYKITL